MPVFTTPTNQPRIGLRCTTLGCRIVSMLWYPISSVAMSCFICNKCPFIMPGRRYRLPVCCEDLLSPSSTVEDIKDIKDIPRACIFFYSICLPPCGLWYSISSQNITMDRNRPLVKLSCLPWQCRGGSLTDSLSYRDS